MPRGFIVDEAGEQSAYVYADGGLVRTQASVFLDQHSTTVVEVFITYFFFIVLAGWVTWQWTRQRKARGSPVPILRGSDRYLIGVLLGGSAGGLFFAVAGVAALFSAEYPTPADLVVGVLFIFLPAYAAVASFLLWARRKQLARSQVAG